MNLITRAASATVLCAALGASLTACNPTSSGAASPPSTVTQAPTKPADPLSGFSGSEVTTMAVGNLKRASTVRFTGSMKDSGSTIVVDLTLVRGKGCKGTMQEHGQGSFKLELIGTTVWLNADRRFWMTHGGNDPNVLAMVANRWIKTSESGDLGSLAGLCDVNKMLAQSTAVPANMQKGSVSTLNGQPALQLSDSGDTASAEVSDTASPELLRVSDPSSADGGTLNFSDYNAPVTLTPPPAEETIDGKSIGL